MNPVERLKVKGDYYGAGVLARLTKQPRYYGCHYGMRSNRAWAMTRFYEGYDFPNES